MGHQIDFRGSLCKSGLAVSVCAVLTLFSSVAMSAGEAKTPEGDGKSEGVDPTNLPVEMTASLEDLLNDPEGVAPERSEKRCINRRVGVTTEILDSEHLLFRRSVGGKAWLNRLTPGCLGLKPDMVLILQSTGANICQLDRVQGTSRLGGTGFPSGICSLGRFEPVTELHAQTLEDTFKLRRKEMAEARRNERVEKRAQRRQARKERRAAKKEAQKAARAESAS